jgi:O-antigen/teichoic acid export membrane protein
VSLKRKTASGTIWNFLTTFAANTIDFAVFAILARLLSIEDFGLLALCLLVIELANIFTNVGVNQNLIQRRKWDNTFASSTFVFIGLLSLFISLLVGLVAAPLGLYLHSETAFFILLTLSIVPFLIGLQSVFAAKLEREFRNKRVTVIRATSSILSGLLAIVLAFSGFGIWSLVIGRLLQSLMTLFGFFVFAHFRPTLTIKREHTSELCAFCLPLMWIAVLNYLNKKAANLYTGFILGTVDFALISVASKGREVLSQSTISPINKMMVPVLSRVDEETRIDAFYKVLGVTSIFVLPAFLGLGAIAPQFIELAFGEKFLPSASLLTITTSMILANVLVWFLPNLLISIAQTKAALSLNLINVSSILIMGIATVWFGVEVMLISITIASYLTVPLKVNVAQRHINIKLSKMIKIIAPAAISSCVMFLCIKLNASNLQLLSTSLPMELLLNILIGGITYTLILVIFFFNTAKKIVSEFKKILDKN